MKVRKYECRFCGLHCECKTTVTPNRCLQYSPGSNPVSKWERVEPKKREVKKCSNCNNSAEYSDGLYCGLSGNPAERVCENWERLVEL